MTLKRQLLIASLLMLLIPWAGLQFVLDLDRALREQAQTQLTEQTTRLGRRLSSGLTDSPPLSSTDKVLYAHTVSRPPTMDGFGSDWPGDNGGSDGPAWHQSAPIDGGGSASWAITVAGDTLFLLLRISGHNHQFFDPADPQRPHDQLRVFFEQGRGVVERAVISTGRGNVTARIPGSDEARDYRVRGVWESIGRGTVQLELQLPRPAYGSAFGFRLVGPAAGQPGYRSLLDNTDSKLAYRRLALESAFNELIAPGQKARVLEPAGWLMARAGRPVTEPDGQFHTLTPTQIIERITLNGLQALVAAYQPEPETLDADGDRFDLAALPDRGLVRHPGEGSFLLASETLAGGRILQLEVSLQQLLSISGSALGSVIARSLLLLIGLMLVLLGYASWLSWRITRLQQAVSDSIDDDGRLLATLPPATAKDELGELSRQFSHLTERLYGYTHYLESFSRRLSHELKTPVAVVRSSLENLSQPNSEQERLSYLARANAATDRLSQILHGMSEAARLEQSLDHAEKEMFDLAPVCREATEAYQALAPEFVIQYEGPATGKPMHGSPELLVQMLDKLVDNARDFTPEGRHITICLNTDSKTPVLSVFNEGSALPSELATDIFSPFVSVRDDAADGHLGQGLLIARLIAEHHGGRIQARNEDGGVRFIVRFAQR